MQIYFSDLNDEAQDRLEAEFGITLNHDFPIGIVTPEDEIHLSEPLVQNNQVTL